MKLLTTLAMVTICSAVQAMDFDAPLVLRYTKLVNDGLQTAQRLVQEEKLSADNSLYRGYRILTAFLQDKKVPSPEVTAQANRIFNETLLIPEIQHELMNRSISETELKSKMLHAAADIINKESKIDLLKKKPDANTLQEILLKNAHITSDQERDCFVASILVAMKINQAVLYSTL